MNKRMWTGVAGGSLLLSLLIVGCKTPAPTMKNPFSRDPKPAIESPADMADLSLKAPPERYTRDDYLQETLDKKDQPIDIARQNQTGNSSGSLAQKGSYQSSGVDRTSPDYVAMNSDSSSRESTPSETNRDRSGNGSGYSAPGFSDPAQSTPSDDSAPFAPGSIGGY